VPLAHATPRKTAPAPKQQAGITVCGALLPLASPTSAASSRNGQEVPRQQYFSPVLPRPAPPRRRGRGRARPRSRSPGHQHRQPAPRQVDDRLAQEGRVVVVRPITLVGPRSRVEATLHRVRTAWSPAAWSGRRPTRDGRSAAGSRRAAGRAGRGLGVDAAEVTSRPTDSAGRTPHRAGPSVFTRARLPSGRRRSRSGRRRE